MLVPELDLPARSDGTASRRLDFMEYAAERAKLYRPPFLLPASYANVDVHQYHRLYLAAAKEFKDVSRSVKSLPTRKDRAQDVSYVMDKRVRATNLAGWLQVANAHLVMASLPDTLVTAQLRLGERLLSEINDWLLRDPGYARVTELSTVLLVTPGGRASLYAKNSEELRDLPVSVPARVRSYMEVPLPRRAAELFPMTEARRLHELQLGVAAVARDKGSELSPGKELSSCHCFHCDGSGNLRAEGFSCSADFLPPTSASAGDGNKGSLDLTSTRSDLARDCDLTVPREDSNKQSRDATPVGPFLPPCRQNIQGWPKSGRSSTEGWRLDTGLDEQPAWATWQWQPRCPSPPPSWQCLLPLSEVTNHPPPIIPGWWPRHDRWEEEPEK